MDHLPCRGHGLIIVFVLDVAYQNSLELEAKDLLPEVKFGPRLCHVHS
jgi:hypothetical protein